MRDRHADSIEGSLIERNQKMHAVRNDFRQNGLETKIWRKERPVAQGSRRHCWEPAHDPSARARTLAKKMAVVVNGESVTDAFVALAILIAGLVASSARNAEEASSLLNRLHRLSGRFVSARIENERENTLN